MDIDPILKKLNQLYDEVVIIESLSTNQKNEILEKIEINNHNLKYHVFAYKYNKKKNITYRKDVVSESLNNIERKLKLTEPIIRKGKFEIDTKKSKLKIDERKNLKNFEELNDELIKLKASKLHLSEMELSKKEISQIQYHENFCYEHKYNFLQLNYEMNYKTANYYNSITTKYPNVSKILNQVDKDHKLLLKMLNPKAIKIKNIKHVIFSPDFTAEILNEFILENLVPDHIIDKSSFFLNNETEFNKNFNIFDINHENFIYNPRYDFEFTKTRDYSIFENGTLKNALIDRFSLEEIKSIIKNSKGSLSKIKLQPNGNFYDDVTEKHLVFGLKKDKEIKKSEELKHNIEDLFDTKTLVINSVLGMHTTKPSEFQFSLVVDQAFFENQFTQGQIIVANLKDLFKSLEFTEPKYDGIAKIRGIKFDIKDHKESFKIVM